MSEGDQWMVKKKQAKKKFITRDHLKEIGLTFLIISMIIFTLLIILADR